MAYRGYKVVAFTPAGRKRTMSILLDNLSRFTDIVDEYQVWMNTDPEQTDDEKWLKTLPETYPWVRLIERQPNQERLEPKQMNTGYFYTNTVDEDTIYIRFDDDIVFIDDDFFKNLLDYRIDHPKPFLVMANIWNNAVISYIQQQLGNIPSDKYVIEEPYCMEPTAWQNGDFAHLIHRILLDKIYAGTTKDLLFGTTVLEDNERFSISCFAFFGKDFAKFGGLVGQDGQGVIGHDEEMWLTEVYPATNDVFNVICGSALVAHYSFFAQRPTLDKTDILDKYRKLGRELLSGAYYKLLDSSNKAGK